MEAFLGKWQVINSESKGLDEYFSKNDTPAEDRYALTSTPWTQSFLKDGDQWVSETAFGDLKETFKFKLGQEVTYKTLSGETVVATFNIKDNKVVGSGTEGGKPVSSCDSIVDGKLQITFTKGGVTAKFLLRKV
ncbi:fatty acid-binding protein homolog 6-like [Pomacea canaliculata]|uniref:fatty acid-binding protein homolog 6-like n=1 Tax=Pomacea canaliculata TaxID=400727 RepID=UPI000D731F66|nr:fatty acid-binding protein homolog 6-like [Pomacea canaliculata]XP_025114183.1 fatty acid-binding protein homolog 6-like [Pomacea canaliculata]XP_025114185.1 fatty acid-binding protein homolog 6-like [Pomacea canaliculata]XP_025114186.1 fatty acid-binding protein homolog 6-like [Pomacea canaliculata]XP_025114187.1 fatty acid-binding protein homolog 6-like [Pomacea canaliculata]XP_025114188.1 fatty acid-binding protein homolog 6-like [Pomacea canaliculata]